MFPFPQLRGIESTAIHLEAYCNTNCRRIEKLFGEVVVVGILSDNPTEASFQAIISLTRFFSFRS